MGGMDIKNMLDNRQLANQIVDLQTQLAFQEDTVQVLNGIVSQHQQDILALQAQIDRLTDELKKLLVQQDFRPVDDIPPPHY